MKRIAIKLVVFLLLGAVMTVAVAWGLAYWFAPRQPTNATYADGTVHVQWSPRELSTGWPFPSLSTEYRILWTDLTVCTRIEIDGRAQMLPLGPLWIGLSLDTLFYAVSLWLAFAGYFGASDRLRYRRGCCIKCGYDLTGAKHGGCPECGASANGGKRQ